MTNAAQSSRVAGSTTRTLFPNVTTSFKTPTYFAEKTFTQDGTANPQIKEKTPANIGHFAIGAILVVVVVVALHKGFQHYGL
jgi:hypothetical protein